MCGRITVRASTHSVTAPHLCQANMTFWSRFLPISLLETSYTCKDKQTSKKARYWFVFVLAEVWHCDRVCLCDRMEVSVMQSHGNDISGENCQFSVSL